jgi:putative solute:sodium symporter small subunit
MPKSKCNSIGIKSKNPVLPLVVWFVVSFGFGIIGVDYLNQFHLGFKLGFFGFTQQGSIFTFAP